MSRKKNSHDRRLILLPGGKNTDSTAPSSPEGTDPMQETFARVKLTPPKYQTVAPTPKTKGAGLEKGRLRFTQLRDLEDYPPHYPQPG